jgi:membrane protease YdiL (CAAX protease family)
MQQRGDVYQSVASTRHTWILTGILLAVALAGFLSLQRAQASGAAPAAAGVATYLTLIAVELGLVAYVRVGLKANGTSLASLISQRPLTAHSLVIDGLLGLLLLGLLVGAEFLLPTLLGRGNRAIVQSLIVHDLRLVPVWVGVAAAAGFAEELTFRGYFQSQYAAWLRRPWLAVIAQAALFGITHGYQGGTLIVEITIFGLIFGAAALARRSLVPGIIAHTGLDLIGGLAGLR